MRSVGNVPIMNSVEFTTPNIIITFNQPVCIKGLPQYLTNTGKLPITASLDTGKLVLTLGYDTPGAVTTITIPQNERAVRSFSGGIVPQGTFLAS